MVGFLLIISIFAVLFVVFIIIKGTKASGNEADHVVLENEVEKEIEKPKLKNNSITLRVAGVTKVNDEKKDIQNLLKRIANTYKKDESLESYNGYTNKEILEDNMETAEFEYQYIYNAVEFVPEPSNKYDVNAIKVILKDANGKSNHIGYVKKDDNVKLLNEIKTNNIKRTTLEFLGGKIKRIEYDWENDKDYIEVDEVTRGVEIVIYFENEIA